MLGEISDLVLAAVCAGAAGLLAAVVRRLWRLTAAGSRPDGPQAARGRRARWRRTG